MRYLIYLLSVLIFTSCQKEDPCPYNYPCEEDETNPTVVETYDPFGEWRLVEGTVFVENMDDRTRFYYDHFGPNRDTSTLNVINGSPLPIDNIIKNATKWTITSNTFTLNDTLEYGLTWYDNGMNLTLSVIGLENGSARPVVFLEIGEDYFTVEIHEAYASSAGINYRYESILTFNRVGYSCGSCSYDTPNGWTYSGVIGDMPVPTSELASTRWVVTRYDQGMSPVYPNDTIWFIDANRYRINSSTVDRGYQLSNVPGNNMKELSLYSISTWGGGDYSGMVGQYFEIDGVINGVEFVDLFNTNNSVQVWMEKIQ